MNIADYPFTIWPWQTQSGFPWPELKFYQGSTVFPLDSGESLSGLFLAYEEWGDPENPTVVIFHALTGDSHAGRHHLHDRPGWWDNVVGPGTVLDPRDYHIIVPNTLGGAMGSFAPSTALPGQEPLGSRFPKMSLFDMARATHELLEWLQVGNRPVLLIGGSMGGMTAMAFASLYPEQARAVLAIGAPIEHSPWAIAFHSVGRTAIRTDPLFRDGNYYSCADCPDRGLRVARMADMISYQSPKSMEEKFGRRYQTSQHTEFQIESYLKYQGEKLTRRFDANSYMVLTEAMDHFSLSEPQLDSLATVPLWMVAMATDMLYPSEEIQSHAERIERRGGWVRFEVMDGPWGHDTFLVDQERSSAVVRQFLASHKTNLPGLRYSKRTV